MRQHPPGWVPAVIGVGIAFLVLLVFTHNTHIEDRADLAGVRTEVSQMRRQLIREEQTQRADAATAAARAADNAARIAALQQGLDEANAKLTAGGQSPVVVNSAPASSPQPTPAPQGSAPKAPSGAGCRLTLPGLGCVLR